MGPFEAARNIEDVLDEADGDHTHCPADGCGHPLVFDPDRVGDTVGGLTRRGWLVCKSCGAGWLSDRGHTVEHWRLANSGRSIETSVGRIRVDGGHDPEALCKRLVRLPELEIENDRNERALPEIAQLLGTVHQADGHADQRGGNASVLTALRALVDEVNRLREQELNSAIAALGRTQDGAP